MGSMELNLEELAKDDYTAARANLIEAGKEEGKIKSSEELISEASKKLEFFDVNWLKYQEDKTIAEIAVIQNCPEGSVKSRLHYTIKILEEKLKIFNPAFT